MRNLLIKVYCNFKLLLSPFKSKIKIICNDDMVNYIKDKNLSIIRFGDGEFRIIQSKKGIHYQDFNEELCNEMEELFYKYADTSKYLLCVPYFLNESIFWYKKMPYSYTACFAKCRMFFRHNYNNKLIYGDAFLFKKDNRKVYEKLWKDEKNIILIHNDIKWAKWLEKEYNLNVTFIKIPSKNAYDVINSVENEIIRINPDKKQKILMSAGPMAKALCYRLAKQDFIVYDTGHCFDEPLEINE